MRGFAWSGPALLALALCACGGGGSDGSSGTGGTPTGTRSAAEGLRVGTATATPGGGSIPLVALVLENGQYWAWSNVPGFGYVSFSAGSATVNGTALNGSASDFTLGAPAVGTSTVTGTVTQNGPLTGNASSTINGNATLSLAYDTRYDQPASLSTVAGAWNVVVAGVASTITVQSNGALSGSSNGCSLSGALTPRGSKNVFDTSVSLSGASCGLAGQTFTGVTLALTSGSNTELLGGLVNSGRTTGILVSGTR